MTDAVDSDEKNKVHGYEHDRVDYSFKRGSSSNCVHQPYNPDTQECEVYVLEAAFTTDGVATDVADPSGKKKDDSYPVGGELHDSIYEICMRLSNLSISE